MGFGSVCRQLGLLSASKQLESTSPSLMEAVDWEVDSLAFSDQTEPESPDVDPEPLEATSRFFGGSRKVYRERESSKRH